MIARSPANLKILYMQCIRLEFFLQNLWNKFISLVAMATSLENLGNEFENANHENTIAAEKNERMVHMIRVMANFMQFWL